MGLPRERRITARREIASLLSGDRARGRDLDLYWRPAAGPLARAICVTPKHGHTSVRRNQLRRRLIDLARRILLARAEPLDYLVRARPGAYALGYDALEAQLGALAGRIGSAPAAPETA
jgi:ribonuclease P protein component